MSEPFIGEIAMFGGNFAPRGWAFCNGQLLAISQYSALFSILGTTYGGDGRTTFGLPNLAGRVPIHAGTGPGLTPRRIGQQGGAETATLSINQMPTHNHHVTQVSNAPATQKSPLGNTLAQPRDGDAYTNAATGVAHSNTITDAPGGNQAHNNLQPYLAVNYIIALVGIYPSRS